MKRQRHFASTSTLLEYRVKSSGLPPAPHTASLEVPAGKAHVRASPDYKSGLRSRSFSRVVNARPERGQASSSRARLHAAAHYSSVQMIRSLLKKQVPTSNPPKTMTALKGPQRCAVSMPKVKLLFGSVLSICYALFLHPGGYPRSHLDVKRKTGNPMSDVNGMVTFGTYNPRDHAVPGD